MAYPTIKLADDLLQNSRLTSVEVTQVLNEHWWCRFTCAQPDDAPIAVESWLGKPLTVSSTDEQKVEHTHFSGFILSVDLVYEASGTFSAHATAVTSSWLLDQAQHKQYYTAQTLAQVAETAVGRVGLTASIKASTSKPLNYVQYGETDFSFLHRIIDDYKAWLRPTARGIEVFDSFQKGVDLEWRGASGLGLLDFTLGGTLKSARFNGSHYDFHAMESQMFQNVSKTPSFSSPSAGLASAVIAQSQSVMPSGFVQQRPRAMTLGDFQTSIEDEAERALGSAITGRGSSRNEQLYAGNTVNITGSIAAAGIYGLVAVTHRWDAGGYGNTFTVTPWKQYRNSEEPLLRTWNGIVPARVTAHNDPKKMGRIQVQFFWQQDGATHWARATSPHAGPDRGFMFLPEVGDEVAVAFEDGDPERPVILGSMWNGVQQAPRGGFFAPTANIPENDVKRLMTKSGNRLQMVDAPGQETMVVATPNHNHVTLTEKSTGTGRPLVHLHSDGDIILSAPNGRVHIQSQFFSREIGSTPPPIAPVPSTPSPARGAETQSEPHLLLASYQTPNSSQTSHASSVSAGKTTTIHHLDGTVEKRHGTASFRNNNPGNLRPGPFATRHGAIGVDPAPPPGHGPWAVFDREQDGDDALRALLVSPDVKKRTVLEEMALYAKKGDGDNNPEKYAKDISDAVGVSPDTPMSELSSDQVSSFMTYVKKQEGFSGTSTVIK